MNRTLEDNSFEIRVVREGPSLLPGSIRPELIQSGRLDAVTEITLEEDLYDGPFGKPWITRDNPYQSATHSEQLGEDGVIRVGSVIGDASLLASVLTPNGQPEKGRIPIRDSSWCAPPGWEGAEVISVQRESSAGRRSEFPRGILERIRVQLRRTIPFHLSDSLAINGLVVPARFLWEDDQAPTDSSGPADLVVPHGVADTLRLPAGEIRPVTANRVSPAASDVVQARSTGPYSLITQMPLRAGYPGGTDVVITDDQVNWLAERNLLGLISEFTSLKSDDLQNRPTLIAMSNGEPVVGDMIPAAPESLLELREYLWGFNLKVELKSTEMGVAVTLRPATDADILARSSGLISKPETINYRTYRPEPLGLFSETVFGPETSAVRRRRTGHIELGEPVVPMLWRVGSQPLLARVLGLESDQVEVLINRSKIIYEKEGVFRFLKVKDPAEKNLLDEGWASLGTGVEAIQSLLKRVSADRIPPVFGTAGEGFFVRIIPMIPPDLRPLVLLDNGNFATSDLNDLYRNLINRNNRLRKLKELNAPAVIIDNERQLLQQVVDSLQANLFVPPKKQTMGDDRRPLVSLLDLLIRRISGDSKKVDWAGRARAIADSRIQSSEAGVPERIFDELRLQADQPVLLTSRHAFVARLPRRIPGPLLRLDHIDADVLLGADQIVCVHQPLTQAARDDARRLMSGERLEVPSNRDPDDWCRHADPHQMLDDLIDAAVSSRTVTMTSGRGLSLSGTGPTTSEIRDTTSSSTTTYWVDAPPKAPPRPMPSLEEISAAIEGHRRRCCLLRVSKRKGKVDPAQGRIGGFPWMPPGAKWPCGPQGEPYEFIGQFPLDPAREAGLISFEVPPGALLTVFWNQQWDHAASTRDHSLVIHGSDNLVELRPPEEDCRVTDRFDIRCELCDIYPDPQDALEIVMWELDRSDRGEFEKFREAYEERFPNPSDVSRIGGYPYWIQEANAIPFFAQICSDGDISFGDAGSMYIYGTSADDLSAFVDCY